MSSSGTGLSFRNPVRMLRRRLKHLQKCVNRFGAVTIWVFVHITQYFVRTVEMVTPG